MVENRTGAQNRKYSFPQLALYDAALERQNLWFRDFRLYRPTKKVQKHSDSFIRRKDTGHHGFKSLKRTFGDFDRKPNFDLGIDCNNFVFPCSVPQCQNRLAVNNCNVIAKMNERLNSGG